MEATAMIDEARRQLAEGHDKQAAALLTDAAYATRDAELEAQIRELAREGRDKAGRFGKGRWDEIIRIAEARAESAGNGSS